MSVIKKLKIGVSGSSGFIGAQLVTDLLAQGHDVFSFVRSPNENESMQKRFLMDAQGLQIDEAILPSLDLFIHCAWNLCGRSDESAAANIRCSNELVDKLASMSIPCLFISSMAAFVGCRSIYGQSKLSVEATVLQKGGIVIRPATVWSSNPHGIVGAILKIVRAFKVAPLIGSGTSKISTVHLEDLSTIVSRVVNTVATYKGKLFLVAAPDRMTLKDFFTRISQHFGLSATFIPIPAWLLFYPLLVLEKLGVRLPLRSDSVTSIVYSNPGEIESLPAELLISFRRLP